MRILHTSDWHLGQSLRDQPREYEHRVFLDWLIEVVGERSVDALVVAGDVFETANPPAPAWRLWFEFLGRLGREHPGLQVVVIAGNHDSPARLEAPADILRGLGMHVIGSLPRGADGDLDVDRLLVPLCDRRGEAAVLCAAVPFLRAADLPAVGRQPAAVLPRPGEPLEPDPLIDGVRAVHEQVFAAACSRLRPGQAMIAMAHCYMVGGEVSELSERKVLGGNQHALPVSLFPAAAQYVALGHLHLPQVVGGREHVRYSGSPLPLSLSERHYPHQVCFADFLDGRLAKVWSLRTPRAVPMLRIPERGASAVEEVLAAIAQLPSRDGSAADHALPYLEVAVALSQPAPGLAERLESAVDGKAVRLVRIEEQATGHGRALAEAVALPRLDALTAEEVFRRRWERDHRDPVPARVLEAFHELVDQAGQEDG